MKTKSKLHPTKNDLSESVRQKAIALLNQNLADAIDLGLQIKQAHWNVKGPNFIALHELFDDVADEAVEFIDSIAERAVALGGTAYGTAQIVSKNTRLAEYPLDIVSGHDHAAALSDALARFGASVRAAITEANNIGDLDTADLFTGISRDVDKRLWMIEAHLQ